MNVLHLLGKKQWDINTLQKNVKLTIQFIFSCSIWSCIEHVIVFEHNLMW